MLGRLFQARQDTLDTDKGHSLARRLSTLVLQPSPLSDNTSVSPPKEKRQGSKGPQNGTLSATTAQNYTNEDSYSRTFLYGTPNHLRCTRFEQFQFRMLIVQDKGELLQRNNYKVCFDSANDHHFDKPGSQKLQYRHSTVELIDFMFGNPIHQDIAVNDRSKIHRLSALRDLPESMLLTKYFKVNQKAYSIAVVVPVASDYFSEAILANWRHISSHLSLVKSTFVENHVQKRNPAVAQNYLDVAILFKQLIISINNLVSIPRLLLGMTQVSTAMFNHWCYEVQNWIEIKDGSRSGQCGTRFLPTLLTIVNSLKNQIVNRDYSDEFVRIVIMAQNPIVAQKLIFILSGILPYQLDFTLDSSDSPHSKSTVTTDFSPKDYEMPLNDKMTPPTPSVISKGWEIPTTPSRSIATPSLMTPTRSSVIQPLSTSQSMAYLSSSLHSHSSFSNSLSRGFSFLQNWKGSLESTVSSSSSTTTTYRSPSPGYEYDEYPWAESNNGNFTTTHQPSTTSTTTTVQPIPFANPLPRSFSSYEVPGSGFKPVKKHVNVPKLPHIERSATTVYGIGGNVCQDDMDQLKRECRLLMQGGEFETCLEIDELKHVSILTVSLDNDEDDEQERQQKIMKKTPPPLCGYLNEFVPEFQLQACPISPDLESKVASAMKSDLHHYSCSRTIVVGLRAREIREIVMMKTTKEVKTQVKKLYGNLRPSGCVDRQALDRVENTMEAMLNGKDISDMVKEW